jgi:5-methyltetrahydropteroyltriglutamate--homocysteine methyltransferase
MAVEAFAPGMYPRSEALVQATRDLDRGRTTEAEVDSRIAADVEDLIGAQQAAGLDLLTDGMLRWQDHFRPLLQAAVGLETGALTRYLDTNTFYRAPKATGAPKLSGPLDERFLASVPGPRVATLSSPYALARGTDVSPKAMAEDVLAPALTGLEAELVVLVEPFLAHDEASPDELREPLEALSNGTTLALWFPFSDAGALLEQGAADLPVDGLGIDFYATHLESVPEGLDKLLLAGVVDVRSSVLEDPAEIAAFAGQLAERGVERIALVPNGDLQYVSEPVARGKLARLGQAKAAA